MHRRHGDPCKMRIKGSKKILKLQAGIPCLYQKIQQVQIQTKDGSKSYTSCDRTNLRLTEQTIYVDGGSCSVVIASRVISQLKTSVFGWRNHIFGRVIDTHKRLLSGNGSVKTNPRFDSWRETGIFVTARGCEVKTETK